MRTLNSEFYKRRSDLESREDFIYIPSLNICVDKKRTCLGKNWTEAHIELQKRRLRMLTPLEFIEFLKYIKVNDPEVYRDIINPNPPWGAEWIDADFKIKNKKLYINSNHVLDSNGNLTPRNSQPLDRETLMPDVHSKISLEYWLNNHTNQGLPRKEAPSGDLDYFPPMEDNSSKAVFSAGGKLKVTFCCRAYSLKDPGLGVRAVFD